MTKPYQPKCYEMIAKHATMKKVAVALLFTIFLFCFALAMVPWQQTALGHGKVVALSPNERRQNIIAPVNGRLGKWYVHDGSRVKKGDKIVQLLDNDPQFLQRLKAEKRAVLIKKKATKTALDTSEVHVKRQRTLYEEGISSRRQYETAKLEYTNFQNQLANIDIKLNNINTTIARQQTQLVTAPLNGTIIHRTPGENAVLVKEGQTLAVLVPKTQSRAVTLWILGNDIPLIRIGQHVRLQFEGWPAIQFSGWPSVAVGTFGGEVKLIDPIDNNRGEFRIIVVPDKSHDWPGPQFLRQGIRVNGWVLLNRVRLWKELWRRLNGFPPSVDIAPTESEIGA